MDDDLGLMQHDAGYGGQLIGQIKHKRRINMYTVYGIVALLAIGLIVAIFI